MSETPAATNTPSGSPSPAPGTVAYLADGGSLVAVRVDRAEDGKVVTHSTDNKERRVSLRRLLWTSSATVADLKQLAAHWKRTTEAASTWDVQGAWSHLAEQGELEPLDADHLRTLLPPELQPSTSDALVVAVFEDPLHFRMRSGRICPTTAEALEAAKAEAAAAGLRAEALERAASALSEVMAGREVDDARSAELERHLVQVESVALFGQEAAAEDVAATRRLLAAAGLGSSEDPRHLAFSALCTVGRFHEDENLAMRREGMPRGFEAEVEAAADLASGLGWSRDGRKDLTGLHTVAIDADHTTEVDDAFAIEGNRLVVFIADVSAFVEAGGVIDVEARRRVSTLYLPQGPIPMLPPALGQGSASLAVGEERPTLAMSFRLGPEGGVADFRLELAICRLDARVSYSRTDELLRGGEAEDPEAARCGALVRTAQRMMNAHRQWRMARGALQLQRSEVEIEVASDGQVAVNTVIANGPARQLISEMMICACAGAAEWCVEQKIPSIYRCQAQPTEGPGNPKGAVTNPAEQAEVLRRLQPTVLTTTPSLHYTLALDAYVQVSSPLRRYSDLVMHRQIKAHLRGEAPPNDAEALRELGQHVERQTAAVRRVEYETRRYWTLKHLAQNPTKVHTAVCVRQVRQRWLVAIDTLAQRALLRTKRRLHPGTALAVVVDAVDPRRNRVVMRAAE